MNSKHFDQLRNYEFGRDDKKSVPNHSHQHAPLNTDQSNASFKPINSSSSRNVPTTHLLNLRNAPDKINSTDQGYNKLSNNGVTQMNHHIQVMQKQFQRSESTDYKIGPPSSIIIDQNEKQGAYTSKRIMNTSKIHSIESSPSRQNRKSPFALHGYKMVTDDLKNIKQIQNQNKEMHKRHHGSITINPSVVSSRANDFILKQDNGINISNSYNNTLQ